MTNIDTLAQPSRAEIALDFNVNQQLAVTPQSGIRPSIGLPNLFPEALVPSDGFARADTAWASCPSPL